MSNISKTELRTKFKNIRNTLNVEIREVKSRAITDLFIENFSFAQNYFVYLSFGSEVITGDIIKHLISNGKNICIPKCDINNLTMKAVRYCTDDFLSKNTYGIYENNTDDFLSDRIDVILLPGLTMDRHGNRIGFGKGYYDKFVNSLDYKPILIGLCYKEQIFEATLPHNDKDAMLDYIITDAEIIKICER